METLHVLKKFFFFVAKEESLVINKFFSFLFYEKWKNAIVGGITIGMYRVSR